jgi:hypothetical protein
MEAAGIEPASRFSRIELFTGDIIEVETNDEAGTVKVRPVEKNGFEHWKLDGDVEAQELDITEGCEVFEPSEHWKLDGEEASRRLASESEAPSPSNFTAKTTICGIDLEVRRDGKHLNLHMLLHEDGHLEQWRFEELETAIPKLACILAAARLAQEV